MGGAADILRATEPNRVRRALRQHYGSDLADLHRELSAALRGTASATTAYVAAYRRLVLELADVALAGDEPGPARDRLREHVARWADAEAANVPTGPWAGDWGAGDAVGLTIAALVREALGDEQLQAPRDWAARAASRAGEPHSLALARFRRQVFAALAVDATEGSLERLMRVFDLSKVELGSLFGVKRQAIDGWLAKGVPADRQEKLTALLALADLLERKLKNGRIPGVARRSADAYGGRTMLELIASDRHDELLALVRESFDWAKAA